MSTHEQGSFITSNSPHILDNSSTQKIMLDVIIAMAPAMVMSVLVFGLRAALLIAVCAGSSAVFEYLYRKWMKKPQTVQDLSAVVTGILIALNIPSTMPVWEAVVGCAFAILVVKQLFGGLGQNFVNPALAARVFLLASFAVAMSSWPEITEWAKGMAGYSVDAVTSATPLSLLAKGESGNLPSNANLFFGFVSGSMGETSALALLIGGVYLCLKKVITPTIPVVYLATVALFALCVGEDPIFHLCAGGVMIGAIFMATDYVTSPITEGGRVIYAIGCGLLTMVIRLSGTYPEGVSFAILIMNIITPHIDNASKKHGYGFGAGKAAEKAAEDAKKAAAAAEKAKAAETSAPTGAKAAEGGK